MTMKHTPGPWKVKEIENVISGKNYFIKDDKNFIAAVALNGGRKRARANARVIAAVPDLVDALESLMIAYGASDGRNGNSGECWDKARAVMAKIKLGE